MSKKNSCRNLCVFEVRGKRNYRYIVLYNSSDFYITNNDVYNGHHLTLSFNKSKMFSYSLLDETKYVSVLPEKKDNKVVVNLDYIGPRRWAIIKIKCNSQRRVVLDGILENCRMVRKRLARYRLLYNEGFICVVSVLTATALFLLFVYSFLIDGIDNSTFKTLAMTCFFMTIFTVYPAFDLCKNFLYIEEKSFKKMRQVISKDQKEDKEREKRIVAQLKARTK